VIEVRAAGVVARGAAFLLQRRFGDAVWALPGGRVVVGEAAGAALAREMAEELGETVRVGELLFVVENRFVHGGAARHELGLCFRAELQPSSPVLARSGPFAGAEAALEFRWFDRNELARVDVRPSFLASALAKPSLEFVHAVVGLPRTQCDRPVAAMAPSPLRGSRPAPHRRR
jgi:ADP-ribose pyrophosphatase YjhB (NUDIX family)